MAEHLTAFDPPADAYAAARFDLSRFDRLDDRDASRLPVDPAGRHRPLTHRQPARWLRPVEHDRPFVDPRRLTIITALAIFAWLAIGLAGAWLAGRL